MQFFHFEPGVLNLWLAVVILIVVPMVIVGFIRRRNPGALKRAVQFPPMSAIERVGYWAVMIPYFAMYGYAVGVPFTDNAVLFTAGMIVFLVALVLRIRAFIDYAATPEGELITHGIYSISRNPGYLAATLAEIGMGLMGGSLLMIVVALYFFVGYQWVSTLEERFCLIHYPDAFPQYRQQVARNFLFF